MQTRHLRADESWFKTSSWREAVERMSVFGEPIAGFAQAVASSPYASALFVCTSMDRLIIGRVKDFSSHEPYLIVRRTGVKGEVQFQYVHSPTERAWTTSVETHAFQHFEHLMKNRLQWFSD